MGRLARYLICLMLTWTSGCVASESSIQEIEEAFKEENYDRAYTLVLPRAQAGDAEYQFTLAMLLANGYGHETPDPSIEERERAALVWLRRAADSGHQKAIDWLADSYAYGWMGLPRNLPLSDCWHVAKQDRAKIPICSDMEYREHIR